MIPLIDDATYSMLNETRKKMNGGSEKLAPVFVPVGPNPEGDAPVRLLFIGQTAYEREEIPAGEPLPLFNAAQAYAEHLRELLVVHESPFWQAIRSITSQVLQAAGNGEMAGDRQQLHKVVGWSNLAKIHRIQDGTSNPPADFIEKQRTACVASLRTELRRARPTAVILMVGGSSPWCEIAHEVFGGDEHWWQNSTDRDRVAGMHSQEFGTAVLWTNHPGWMRRQGQAAEDLGFVAGHITALMSGDNAR